MCYLTKTVTCTCLCFSSVGNWVIYLNILTDTFSSKSLIQHNTKKRDIKMKKNHHSQNDSKSPHSE